MVREERTSLGQVEVLLAEIRDEAEQGDPAAQYADYNVEVVNGQGRHLNPGSLAPGGNWALELRLGQPALCRPTQVMNRRISGHSGAVLAGSRGGRKTGGRSGGNKRY